MEIYEVNFLPGFTNIAMPREAVVNPPTPPGQVEGQLWPR